MHTLDPRRLALALALAAGACLAATAPAAAQFRVENFATGGNARAGWIETATPPPGETDPSSIELFVNASSPMDASTAAHVTFAGFGAEPPAVSPGFDYRASTDGLSGGSPRLTMRLTSGGGELRPVNLFAGVWARPDGSSDWDSYGGVCGFRANVSYAELLACQPGARVTGVQIWNDSGWLHNGGFQVLVDNVTFRGEIVSKQDVDVLRGGAVGSPLRVNARPKSGEVLVRLPPSEGVGDFQPLSQVVDIPVRSVVDSSNGTLELSTEADRSGRFEAGQFSGGVFQILRPTRGPADAGVTELRLRSASDPACQGSEARAASLTRALYSDVRRRRHRRLGSSAAAAPDGGFRVRARNSVARAVDAKWDTLERCDGTFTRVARGRVFVRDLSRGRSEVVGAGESYLAP